MIGHFTLVFSFMFTALYPRRQLWEMETSKAENALFLLYHYVHTFKK